MWIQPDSNIWLLHNVPLDNTYEHEIWFNKGDNMSTSRQNQFEYFFNKYHKKSFGYYSYQRVTNGTIRVEDVADNLYDCNYLIFQNNAYGTKYFYAFITSVLYINDHVTEIHYEIDVIQTWHFDYEMEKCFVEREHPVSDTIEYQLVSENLDLGSEYVTCKKEFYSLNDMSVCVLVSDGAGETQKGASITYNVLMVTDYYITMPLEEGVMGPIPVNAKGVQYINELLNKLNENEIIGIFMYPTILYNNKVEAGITDPWDSNRIADYYTLTRPTALGPTEFEKYYPKNDKLFTYPYSRLLVSNNNGSTAEYRWEHFYGSRDTFGGYTFALMGTPLLIPQAMMVPVFYCGEQNAEPMYGLTLSDFPQVAWTGDTFKNWWQSHKASFVTSTITSAVAHLTGLMSPFPDTQTRGLIGGVADVTNSVAKMIDIQNTPPQVYGQVQSDCFNTTFKRVGFTFYQQSIDVPHLKVIDDYFTRFGYQTNRLKVPNRIIERLNWCYTKTISATITGSVPADDMKKICSIYDNGITFWKKGSEIGSYYLEDDDILEKKQTNI